MKKLLVYFNIICFLFGLFPTAVFAETVDVYTGKKIRAIEIKGNRNVKESAIREKMKLSKGDFYNQGSVDEDIQKINELGLFDEVKVDLEEVKKGVKLIYYLVEKPIIKKIEFKGNKKFPNRRLKEKIASKEEESYNKTRVEDDLGKLIIFYKDEGYSEVKVEAFPAVDEKTNQAVITFFIREGKQVLVDKVLLSGTKDFSAKKVLKGMKLRRKKVFKEDTLRADIKEIESFYKNRGYLQVTVVEPQITYNKERTKVSIEIKVVEGRKFRFGAITFEGSSLYPEKKLLTNLTFKPGQIFSQQELDKSVENVHQLYYSKGYLRSLVEAKQDVQEIAGILNVAVNITEGGIVYIDRIYIEGNTFTKDYVLRRELLVKEGDPFDLTKIKRSQEKLYNLGFLKEVSIDIQETPVEDKADLAIDIKEDKPGILTMGAGYSSVDRFSGTLQVSHVNMFGLGQRLNLLWEFGQRKQNYEIGFTEPWIFSNPIYAESPSALFRWLNRHQTTAGFGVFNTIRKRQYGTESDAYKEQRRGGDLRLGRSFTDFVSGNLTYSYEEIKLFDSIVTDVKPSLAVTSSISSGLSRDSRDNIFDAARGSRNSVSVELAGGPVGGNVHFYRPSVTSSWFFPTFWKFVFSTNLRLGLIRSFPPSSEIPVYERYYVGGADTVRGYDYRGQIGPQEGGNIMSVVNAEYKFPFVEEGGRTILQGAFFFDLGGAWRNFRDIRLALGNEELNWKAGVGFGIRIFVMAVFPIRLDWGYGLNHRRDIQKASRHQFYFTIGQVF
ncbi:MAG: outer membrane protein assembly factor BamA [Elusimicrobiota bacterium]